MTQTLYPMQLGGGLFLICIGTGIAVGALLGLHWLMYGVVAGAIIGFASIVGSARAAAARRGRPTRAQVYIMYMAIALEVAAFVALSASGYLAAWPVRTQWIVVLVVVAAHFLIMRFSHGPWIMWLGLATMTWLAVSSFTPLSLDPIVAVDGLLKAIFGLMMAKPLLQPLPRATPDSAGR